MGIITLTIRDSIAKHSIFIGFLRRNSIAKDRLQANVFTDTCHSNQIWRFHDNTHYPRQFGKPRYPIMPRSFNPHTQSLPFSTSSDANSKFKVGFIGWYLGKLDSRPIFTKVVTTSIIYAAADFTAQMISSSSPGSLDLVRMLRMAGYGFLILGPSQHLWFNYMSKILPRRDMLTTLKKILLGQAVYGPANIAVFFSYNAALQGESSDEITARLKRDLLPTMKTGLLFWPICDFATYKFMPVHLQPLVNSTCAYVWTIYLTFMASLEKASSS